MEWRVNFYEKYILDIAYFDVGQFIYPIRPQPANCLPEKQYCAIKRDRMPQLEPVLIFSDG